ncbi:MAG: DNA primase [Lentisphaeria bacterium]|nr:DNA primase [Lentisphaeria bacterium]
MPLIPEEIIDEIAARADLVEIVHGYVPDLKQAGSRWKACCPFHHEKTPSFIVNPDSNTYHCFGCGAGGNVFKFVMTVENLDFPGAVQLLARKYNVMIPEPEPYRGPGRSGQDDGRANYNLRERLYLLHEKLAAWYVSWLKNNPDSKAAAYFRSREIEPSFALRFQIGAAPDSWDAMLQWARKEGFTLEELQAAHLVSESKNQAGKFFDFFRNRLIFPIWNEQGRVVGFSARQIDKEQGGGKYVNSMESPIFKKGRILYGLNFTRPEIPKKGSVILCEGQMDVIAMHTAGCTNAVAPQGTAFGDEQAAVLHRYTDTVLLATDADSAGVKAVLKDATILLPRGFHLKVVSFPGGKDPDELLHNSGAEAVRAAVDSADDFFDFLYRNATEKYDPADPDGKVRIAAVLLEYIRLLDNEVARDSYLNWLADRLKLSVETLAAELRKTEASHRHSPLTDRRRERMGETPASAEKSSAPLPPSMTDPKLKVVFAELFRNILHHQACAEKAARELPPEYLDDGPVAQAVMIELQAFLDNEWKQGPARISRALASCQLDCSEVFTVLAEEVPEPDPDPDPEKEKKKEEIPLQIVSDCLSSIRRKHLQQQIADLRKLLTGPVSEEERHDLLGEFMELTKQLAETGK